jgi:hypothetical protein
MDLGRQIFTPYLNHFYWNVITTWRFITFQLCNSNLNSKGLGQGTNGSAVCISLFLTLLTLYTFNN